MVSFCSSARSARLKTLRNAKASHQVRASLYNHLSDTGTAEGLAADESLPADSSEEVADGGERQENGRCNQATDSDENAEVLYHGHDGVGSGAEVVGRNFADKVVELARGRADAQQKRHFDE